MIFYYNNNHKKNVTNLPAIYTSFLYLNIFFSKCLVIASLTFVFKIGMTDYLKGR